MRDPARHQQLIELDIEQPIWDRFFWVAPLVLIGTREPDGGHDLAPKHMAIPIGWDNFYGFVCTPSHHTYSNIQRERVFTHSAHSRVCASTSRPSGGDRDCSR